MADNIGEIAQAIKFRLQRTRQPGLDDDIIFEANRACKKYESKVTLPWFLLRTVVENTPADAETLVDIPPVNFLREFEDYPLSMQMEDGSYRECFKEDIGVVIRQTCLSMYDTPFYALVGNEIITRPVQTEEKTYKFLYYARSDALVNVASTNVWVEHAEPLLIGEVGEAVAASLGSPKIQLFSALKMEAYADLWKTNTARTEAAIRRVLGGRL